MLSVGFKLSNIFSKLHFQALNMVEIASLIMLSLKIINLAAFCDNTACIFSGEGNPRMHCNRLKINPRWQMRQGECLWTLCSNPEIIQISEFNKTCTI